MGNSIPVNRGQRLNRTKSQTIVLVVALVSLLAVLVTASQDPDSRPRRSTPSAVANPTATPTPINITTPVSRTSNSQTVPKQPTPTATPAPAAKPTSDGQVAPV